MPTFVAALDGQARGLVVRSSGDADTAALEDLLELQGHGLKVVWPIARPDASERPQEGSKKVIPLAA